MVNNRLANQHPIERILVQNRKADQLERGILIELQRINMMKFPLSRHESLRWFWERQPS
jgi:hypothetical protein